MGRFQNDKGEVKWPEVAEWLMDECRRRGVYDPDLVRGRGVWIDGDRVVLHAGDSLIVDGERLPLVLSDSRHIYEAGRPLLRSPGEALPVSEAHKLLKICEMLRWEKPNHARLLAGWIAIAPICGALRWRPSIWLTGGKGSGKSYVSEAIIYGTLGRIALSVLGTTTSAAVRQVLGSESRPVLFDEAEAEDAASAMRMQAMLDLVRQSSSESEAVIAKGGASGRASTYRVRACFAFQSINISLKHAADESRVSVLVLREAAQRSAESSAQFEALAALVAQTITPEWADGLVLRMVRLVPVIRESAEIFAQVIAAKLGSRRLGDQLGTLLAGAYALHSDKPITPEKAAEVVSRPEWLEQAEEAEPDERRCLSHMLAHRLRLDGSEISVSRLIECAHSLDIECTPNPERARRLLSEHGVKYGEHAGRFGCWVSTDHPAMQPIMRGTPWATAWAKSLARLPGSASGRDVGMIRFGLGHRSRAVWLPMATIDPD
jgi:putative DNA primase/helicase